MRSGIGRICGPLRGRIAGRIRTAPLRHSGPLGPRLARFAYTTDSTPEFPDHALTTMIEGVFGKLGGSEETRQQIGVRTQ